MNRSYTGRTVSKLITSTTTGAGADLVYEVPPRHEAEVCLLSVSNADGSNKKISIQLKDNGSYHYIVKEKAISGNSFVPLITSERFYLKEGDRIVAYKEAGTYDITVTISVKQSFKSVRT